MAVCCNWSRHKPGCKVYDSSVSYVWQYAVTGPDTNQVVRSMTIV